MQEVPERHTKPGLSNFDEFSRRYQVLLQTADPIARQTLPELLRELSQLLHEVVDFHSLSYGFHEQNARTMLVYTLDESIQVPEHPVELSIEDFPADVGRNESSALGAGGPESQGGLRCNPSLASL